MTRFVIRYEIKRNRHGKEIFVKEEDSFVSLIDATRYFDFLKREGDCRGIELFKAVFSKITYD